MSVGRTTCTGHGSLACRARRLLIRATDDMPYCTMRTALTKLNDSFATIINPRLINALDPILRERHAIAMQRISYFAEIYWSMCIRLLIKYWFFFHIRFSQGGKRYEDHTNISDYQKASVHIVVTRYLAVRNSNNKTRFQNINDTCRSLHKFVQ